MIGRRFMVCKILRRPFVGDEDCGFQCGTPLFDFCPLRKPHFWRCIGTFRIPTVSHELLVSDGMTASE
jgi:hypothetical protein